jgi:hypothetical protein
MDWNPTTKQMVAHACVRGAWVGVVELGVFEVCGMLLQAAFVHQILSGDAQQLQSQRCMPATNEQAPPSMHCTAFWTPCRHADARWAADVDYMFFRNSYGVTSQLASKLRPCRGSGAMCCQCSWASCSTATKLADAASEAGHSLRWICRGHE